MRLGDPEVMAIYLRIRAACCDEHGLAGKHALDLHAAAVAEVVIQARERERERVSA